MKMNFDKVTDSVTNEFPIIGAGEAVVIIKEITIEPSSKGGENLVIDLQDTDSKANSREYLGFKDANGEPVMFVMSRIKKLLNISGNIPEGEVSMTLIPRLLAGAKFKATFEHREHNGKKYANINWNVDLVPVVETVTTNTTVTPTEAVQQAVTESIEVDI